MRRREFLVWLGGGIVVARILHAQEKAIPVIGFLGITSGRAFAPFVTAFRGGLQEAGYIEGQSVKIEYRWADGHYDRLAALAADLVSRRVDVIATSGGVAVARAAKAATSTIPIVFETGVDPVESGLVASFPRPGGNLTGVSIITAELNTKRLELLYELVPQVRVIAMLVNPNSARERIIQDVEDAARTKGVELHILKAGAENEFDTAFASLAPMHAGALLVGNDPFFFSRRDELVTLAARHAVPAIYEWREFVTAGGLASYGTSIADMYRRLGAYVARVWRAPSPPICRSNSRRHSNWS
jgi:putative ABC transport system substrate-binding protein